MKFILETGSTLSIVSQDGIDSVNLDGVYIGSGCVLFFDAPIENPNFIGFGDSIPQINKHLVLMDDNRSIIYQSPKIKKIL